MGRNSVGFEGIRRCPFALRARSAVLTDLKFDIGQRRLGHGRILVDRLPDEAQVLIFAAYFVEIETGFGFPECDARSCNFREETTFLAK
jgi:hypothetical protein